MSSKDQEIQIAASRALELISSSAQARSQPSTPINNSDNKASKLNLNLNQNHDHDILNIFMSPSKPKSKLRQMAENSAKKYSRTSLPNQTHNNQNTSREVIIDLGTPNKPKIDSLSLKKYKPPERRSLQPRRSSLISKKPTSPSKSPKFPLKDLMDDLELFNLQSTSNPSSSSQVEPTQVQLTIKPYETQQEPQKQSNASIFGLSSDPKADQAQNSLVAKSLETPNEHQKQPKSTRKSRRLTILHLSDDQSSTQPATEIDQHNTGLPSVATIAEVCETVNCNGNGEHNESPKPFADMTDSDSDSFDPNTLLPQKKDQNDPVDDQEGPDSDDLHPIQLNSSKIRSSRKAKLVISESDEDVLPPFKSTQAFKLHDPSQTLTPIISHLKQKRPNLMPGGIIEIDDSNSEDSVEIDPLRAAQFQESRSKTLSTLSTNIPVLNQRRTSDNIGKNPLTSVKDENVALNNSLVSSPTVNPKTSLKLKEKKRQTKLVADSLTDLSEIDDTKLEREKPAIIPDSSSCPKVGKRTGTQAKKTPKKEVPFAKRRDELAEGLIEKLDDQVFGNQLPAQLALVWSKRLNTTAGRAKWTTVKDSAGNILREKVEIELSTKVVDSVEKLRNTLAHELCHVATWIIDRQKDEKHGRYFKAWARKIHKLMPEIEVTTKHHYKIAYKFNWRCTNDDCDITYGRHSKSIKVNKHMCICGASLVEIPRTKKGASSMQMTQEKTDELSGLMGGLQVK
ncbi:hypothetical protein O181_018014 [Austropuccinia psidii MF-1]|uniref:SprT-like domain-containing protein n=1 Tax=Austropuccinia psidii MF-1 TaxID=1389203 RepID=A0A9Q3GTC7_9BASI|nr:hypothetical protein [Austropuccinia psidii MF-1]